jgi:putative Ca2+/H+ antiporter (TMEM165/GDT1 family)
MKGVAVLLLLAVFPVIMGDLFESFDQNHDGSIDRQEYTQGMAKLTAALDGEMPEAVSFFSQLHATEGFWKAFTSGVAMILATEIGDKTFFIAAVMSMRYDRSAVFGGAILALVIMTILSSLMGQVLPAILPKQYTHILGGILFLYFGIKLVNESRSMEANRVSEELEEVEEELLHEKKRDDFDEENPNGVSQPKPRKLKMNWYQVFLESLSLTFLAEWGDRSQIATIALSAAKNPYGVTVGGCLGHMLCTGLAVMGGRMLAARISEKTVAFWGGIVFFIFGVHSLFFEK